ncbi:MAG: competence/damage-inducible protein A [Saprospiraceae bacterium]|nr:competence/damage-inducible protein A [Saprospiraceae bacterium]
METSNTVKASLITIGDEILIGQIVDTNSSWIGQELTDAGVDVIARYAVGDAEQDIEEKLELAGRKSDIVIVTGGLGPTDDDVTKAAIAGYFESDLYFDEEAFIWLSELLERYGRKPLESHREQCWLPKGSQKFMNRLGTAPGLLMSKEDCHYLFTPGVPVEMKYIFKNGFLPWLAENYNLPPIVYKTILTAGLGESQVAEIVGPVVSELPDEVRIAYLPGISTVRVRVLAKNMPEKKGWSVVESASKKVAEELGDAVYGFDEDTLPASVGKLLRSQNKSLTLAESCTGGYISHLITTVPGCSEYFTGSIVSYSYDLKTSELGVPEKLLWQYGAVSEETVIAMAEGALKRYKADVVLAVSGIAGPDGGTKDKPVGTVWMCVSDGKRTKTRLFNFGKSRVLNIKQTGIVGLNMIRKFLLGSDLA